MRRYRFPIAGLLAATTAVAGGGIASMANAQMIERLPDADTPQAPQTDLIAAYQRARTYDPQILGAVAERRVNLATASQAVTQLLPQASYQMTSVPNENTTRQIVSVTQPVFSVDRYAVFRQRGPRRNYAEATFGVAEQSLATRLLTEVCKYIKAVEGAKLNDSEIASLRQQADRSDRLYRNGLGTVTDARDIEVRYEQAAANKFILESEQRAAAARVEAITGKPVMPGDFALAADLGTIPLDGIAAYLDRQNDSNPTIAAARASERISKFEALRAKGALLPTVGVSGVYTRSRGVSENYVGLSIQAPLGPTGFYQIRGANAAAQRSSEQRRQAELQAKVDLTRLYELVDGGQKALVVSERAIGAAELSVEANSKSYEGGVRSSIDVVNAIQTLSQVKNNYVNSAIQIANNLLTLLLLTGASPEESLAATQRFLFAK